MKLFVLAALTLTTAAHAQFDFSLCNDSINRTFQKDKTFPHGFVQINGRGEIEAAKCGGDKASRCQIKSFNRYAPKEDYKVVQQAAYGPYLEAVKDFTIVRGLDGKISKIISGEDELQLSYTDKKCVATALVADIPDENIREMNFDLIACKTFHEIQKRHGQKMSDCYSKDMSNLTEADTKSIKKIGTSCTNELKETYKHLVSLKADIISRYSDDATLKRKPFINIVPPSVFNDQIIENFICSYEASFSAPSGKKECAQNVFELTAPSETALGVILGNKKTCNLIFSENTLNNEEIFKPKYFDSLVYSLVLPQTGGKRIEKDGSQTRAKSQ